MGVLDSIPFYSISNRENIDELQPAIETLWRHGVEVQESFGSFADFVLSVSEGGIEYFYSTHFNKFLRKFLEEHEGKDLEDCVRCYAPYRNGFLMYHGYNYDWFDKDVLGGNGTTNVMRDKLLDLWGCSKERVHVRYLNKPIQAYRY